MVVNGVYRYHRRIRLWTGPSVTLKYLPLCFKDCEFIGFFRLYLCLACPAVVCLFCTTFRLALFTILSFDSMTLSCPVLAIAVIFIASCTLALVKRQYSPPLWFGKLHTVLLDDE